jgi:putative transposase
LILASAQQGSHLDIQDLTQFSIFGSIERMSRPLRVLIPDGWYHVMARGNERKTVFRDDRDCKHFLELLGQLPERFELNVAAYALMGNHYHLIVQTPRANLSAAIQWLNAGYCIWFNARHQRTGHVLQGRFKAVVVDGNGSWLWMLAEYVHLNPIRITSIGLGKSKRAAERAGLSPAPSREEVLRRLTALRAHQWTSYAAYAGHVKAPAWLSMKPVLDRTPGSERNLHRRYRARMEETLRQGMKENPWSKLFAQIAIGSETFCKSFQARGDRREMTALRKLERQVDWNDVRRGVERIKEERWEDFRDRHGDWGRDMALTVARLKCGMTLSSLGTVAGGMHYSAVSQAVRTFQHRLRHDKHLLAVWSRLIKEINS